MPLTTPQPGTVRFDPRGRPALAVTGLLIALAGLVLAGLFAANILPTSALSSPNVAAPTQQPVVKLHPAGAQPAGFVAYSDPRGLFALYISSTWHGSATTLVASGASYPATTFAPSGTALPEWSIADLPIASSSTDVTTLAGQLVQAQGGTGLAPSGSPGSVTAGAYQWSHLSATAQLRGATVQLDVYLRGQGQSSVVVFDEALAITASGSEGTEQQDFAPMLASLTLA
jgi:hypothetical protein